MTDTTDIGIYWILALQNGGDSDYSIFNTEEGARELATEWLLSEWYRSLVSDAAWRPSMGEWAPPPAIVLYRQALRPASLHDDDWCWWDHNARAVVVQEW